MKCKIERVAVGLATTATITIVTEEKSAARGLWDDFRDVDVEISVKKYHKKRSLDSNSYAWTLLSQIAFVLGLSKEETYQAIVRDYGLSHTESMTAEAADFICKLWSYKGLGWQAEVVGRNRTDPKYVDVIFYVGSSAYDEAEFAKFVEAVISECKGLSIPYETGCLKALLEDGDEKHIS